MQLYAVLRVKTVEIVLSLDNVIALMNGKERDAQKVYYHSNVTCFVYQEIINNSSYLFGWILHEWRDLFPPQHQLHMHRTMG